MPPKKEGPARKALAAYFQKKEKADSDGKRRRRNDNGRHLGARSVGGMDRKDANREIGVPRFVRI